jgi:sulfatase modifying factor 1
MRPLSSPNRSRRCIVSVVALLVTDCGGITASQRSNGDPGTGTGGASSDGSSEPKDTRGVAVRRSSASCDGLAATCGLNGSEDCCTSPLVTGGTFYRSYDGEGSYTSKAYPATVSDFRLDKFEITVGRFRKFVAAYSQNMIPAGAGKNPNDASDPGWNAAWNTSLPTDAAALAASLHGTNQTWTPNAGANEDRPVNYINWLEASAFCIWDDGRLPTEAEWNYAAAGGSEQRRYPWGAAAPGANLAVYGCDYNPHVGYCPGGVADIALVGSVSAGNGKWGQADLAGNLSEWTLDWAVSPYAQTPCINCANTTEGQKQWDGNEAAKVIRGGSFVPDNSDLPASSSLLSSYRGSNYQQGNNYPVGSRCARSAP